MVVDFPLHDVGSAGGAFFGFVGEEADGDFLADGHIDGPERLVVALVVECDGEGLEGRGDVGEGVGGAHVAAGRVRDELFDAPGERESEESGRREGCCQSQFVGE